MKISDIILENADIPTSQSEMADEILQGFKTRSGIRNPESNNVNVDVASREAWLIFQQGSMGMDAAIQKALSQQGFSRSGKKITAKSEPKSDSKPEPRKPSAEPKPKKSKRNKADNKVPDRKDPPATDNWEDETGWQRIKRKAASAYAAGSALANINVK